MTEEKVARICWSSNNWEKPSGKDGKSRNKEAYEYLYGFGHEEWLLDTKKIIDGYHYAYLQATRTPKNKYIGKKFNISLYSINNKTKRRFWIGRLKNVKIITLEESRLTYNAYKDRKWLSEMEEQIREVDADVAEFKKIDPEYFSTIKFKLSEMEIDGTPMKLISDDPSITSDYYNLKDKVCEPKLERGNFIFVPGHKEGKDSVTSTYQGQSQKKDLAHNRIQTDIYKLLTSKYGSNNVGTEKATGFGTSIDVVLKTDKERYVFYEIKTKNSLKTCIREGLTQLLEYSYYPDNKVASKLIIVSPNIMNKEDQIYLNTLRGKFNIPIYYQRFNMASAILEETEY
ncbi:MAG: hypothetical protein FVQ81_12485 [Candidatus Glassbacteria bacterium]|nr:hypothetical protein [Candidatus Glassbacteria bacterium]